MIKQKSFIEKKIHDSCDNKKKLNLILGLGHCIIHHEHIINVAVANEMNNQQNRKKINKNIDKEIFYIKIKGNTHKIYLREGVIAFLKKSEKYFNIYIYTFFDFNFAIAICNKINKICKKKIISKIVHKNDVYDNEEIKKKKKKLLHIENIDINKTIIIDSCIDYWDMQYHYRLIEISPYHSNDCDINSINKTIRKFPFTNMNNFFSLCEIFLVSQDLERYYTLLKERKNIL
jgi:hypothetical protein